MALLVTRYPAPVSLAGNDVAFKVATDNEYASKGTGAHIKLKFTGTDTNQDHKFKLAWGSIEIEFVLKTNPGTDGKQLPAAGAGEPLADWVGRLVEYLNYNYCLINDFEVTHDSVGGEFIDINARVVGSSYTLTFTNDPTNPVLNVTQTTDVHGVDPILRENYFLIGRTWIKDGNAWKLLGEDWLKPDSSTEVLFRVQEYLKDELDDVYDFSFPGDPDVFLIKRGSMIRQFYLEYAETYDNEVKRLYNTLATATRVINGGLDTAKLAAYNDDGTNWFAQLQVSKDFLTWQPNGKIVTAFQPEKLFYLVHSSGITTLKLRITIHYSDGSTSGIVLATASCAQYDIWEIMLVYNRLDLDSKAPAKIVRSYDVFLCDQDDREISIKRTFYIDRKAYEQEYFFIFRNSLGFAETLRCAGMTERTSEIEREVLESIPGIDYSRRDFINKYHTASELQVFTFNTGWLDKLSKFPLAYSDYLREFLLSDRIYQVADNRLYPVLITGKKTLISKDDSKMYAMEFEAVRAYTDKYYSADDTLRRKLVFGSKFNDEFVK